MEKISVIIVHWNVPQSLQHCLQSLQATQYPELEIIVIDNASNKAPNLSKVTQVTYLKNQENIGFPKAVNQGLKIATGDYVLVLNPDTRIEKDFFTKAVRFAKDHPDIGVMGPKFMDPDGTPQGSVFAEQSIWRETPKYTPATTSEVFSVSGACMFMPMSTVKKIGLLTEKVFMYYEDLDYCRRIHKAGLKVYFNADIAIVHEHGKSSTLNPKSLKYLQDASLWYNGPIKHYFMWFISWTKQKMKRLL